MRWLKAIFAWRRVNIGGGVWSYWENTVTGDRKAVREMGGWQPLAWDWLIGGRRWKVRQ